MALRPFAPLAVVGAGLLMVALATHAASADAGEAPTGVQAATQGTGLLISWQAPDGSTRPDHYAIALTGADGGVLLSKEVDGSAQQTTATAEQLGTATSARLVVAAEYGGDHVDADPVQVVLHPGPAKPELAPAVRVSGRTLTVKLPKGGPDGATGRVLRVLRDDSVWATVDVPLTRTTVTMHVPIGHAYAAAYQVVGPEGESPFSETTVAVMPHAGGPAAVTGVTAQQTPAGLQVAWQPTAAQGADAASYTVKVLQNGHRVGSSWTAASLTQVLVPVQNLRGAVVVVVKAKDAAGATSTSAKPIDLGD